MKRTIFAAAAFAAAVVLGARTHGPLPGGFKSFGTMMLDDGNAAGALAQLEAYRQACGRGDADADLAYARAVLQNGRTSEARALLLAWLDRWPASADRYAVKALVGETHLYEGQWAAALAVFEGVDADGLTGDALTRFDYDKAYSLMMLGDYDKALACFASIPSWGQYEYLNAGRFYTAYIAFVQGRYADAAGLFLNTNPNIEPSSSRDYYLGQIYYIQGEWDKALAAARTARKLALPRELQAENLRVIGECLYHDGDGAGALECLLQYASMVKDPRPSALYILGKAEYDTGRWREAVETLGRVAAQCDDAMGQSAYLYIGQACLKEGDTQAALLAFNKAQDMPWDAEVAETAMYDYAVAAMAGGTLPFASSAMVLEEFVNRYPESPRTPKVQEYIITGYITDNDYDAALKSIQRVKSPGQAVLKAKQRVLYTLGSRALARNDLDEAEKQLRQAAALARYDAAIGAETALLLGEVAYARGRSDEAAAAYLDYLSKAPDAANAPLARFNLGYARFGQQRFDDAVIDFQRALSSGRLPADLKADAWNRIGDARYYTSQWDVAEEAYGHALDAAPATGDYALYRRSMMKGLQRRYDAQLADIKTLGERFPSSPLLPDALLDKAVALGQLGRDGEAVEAYETLVERYPSSPKTREAYVQMAQMLENDKQKDRAVEAYKKVVADYPTSDEAAVAVMALKRIGADDGRIEEYAGYVSSVKGAPSINPDEVARIQFEKAEQAYDREGSTEALASFAAAHPDNPLTARALACLAEEAGSDDETLRYCQEILDRFPHSESAVDALELKGDISLRQGRHRTALETFSMLASRGGAGDVSRARQGIMRAADALGLQDTVVEQATALLASADAGRDERLEALVLRGKALVSQGKTEKGTADWSEASLATDDADGAKASVLLAEHYVASDQPAKAITEANRLISARTPHQYWTARAFIALSDAKRLQGRAFEADEYLKALRQNYPGNEADIQSMIQSRLKK